MGSGTNERLIIGGPMDGATWATDAKFIEAGYDFPPKSSRFPEHGKYVKRKYRMLDDVGVLECWVWDADIKGGN